MRPLLLSLALLLASAPARAACERPYSSDELARFLSTADVAFVNMDDTTFRLALDQARKVIPCLSEPLSTSDASAWHRAQALASFLDRDHTQVVQHFRAMLWASPGMQLSADFAPEGHPLRFDFEIAEGLPAAGARPVPQPEGAVVYVDGAESTEAPDTLPFVLQVRGVDGAMKVSAVVDAGGPLPDLGVPEPEAAAQRTSRAGRERLRAPLVATAVVAAAASASLYGMSAARNAEFWDPATAREDLDGLRRQTNTLAGVSLGAGVVAVGTGTAAVLSFTW